MSANDKPADATAVQDGLIEMTAEIVSAYVSSNRVQLAEVAALINSVHTILSNLGRVATAAEPEVHRPTPAQIRKSIMPDALISFIDGKAYKTLKRHLTSHGLDPQSYRARYGLPADYPTTATAYSEARSALARTLGLGLKAVIKAESEPEAVGATASKTDGRRNKNAAE